MNPNYANAIASIESGGRYNLLGPRTRKGDRAYGKYQVMGANVPEWTQSALGRAMTADEFLQNPEAQDAVFNHRFGSYVDKYGPEGAAKAWFAGEGGMNNPNAADQLGTTVSSYAGRFMNKLGGAVADGSDVIPDSAQPTAGTAPPQLGPFQVGGPAARPSKDGPDWDKAIMGAATSLMAASDPKGAAVLAAMNKDDNKDHWVTSTLPDGRVIQTNSRTGEWRQATTVSKQDNIVRDESAKKLIDVNSKHFEGLGKGATDAQTQLGTIDEIERALATPGVYQGSAGGAVNSLRKAANSVGLGDFSGVADADVANALGGRLALTLRQNMPGSLSDSDRKFLEAMAPGTALTPEANARLIRIYRNTAQDSIDAYKAAQQHLTNGGYFDASYNRSVTDFSESRRKQRNDDEKNRTNPKASLKAKYGLE